MITHKKIIKNFTVPAEFSASVVGTPPPSRIKGADAAPKRWEVSRSDPPPSGQRR